MITRVRQAGGFIIQLMPGASDDCIDRLEARLGEMSSITALLDAGKTPEEILEDLLGDMGLEILDRLPARFHCDCHKSRVARAYEHWKKRTQSMIDEGKPIEVSCHFCNKIYTFTVDELKGCWKRPPGHKGYGSETPERTGSRRMLQKGVLQRKGFGKLLHLFCSIL